MAVHRSILAAGCATALLLAATQSHANTVIDVGSAGISPQNLQSISIDYTGPGGPVVIPDVYAGVINLNLTNTSPYDPGGTLGVFCIDVFTDLQSSGYFVAESALENGEGVTLSAQTKADIGWLVNNYTNPDATTLALETSGMSQNEFAAATQLAIWQTEYTPADFSFNSYGDPSENIGGPLDPGWVKDLENDLAGSATFAGDISEWEPSDSNGNPNPALNQGQAFIGGPGITNNQPVPEPASLVLLSAGLLGLATVRRRNRG
jgi:hypothetical protein